LADRHAPELCGISPLEIFPYYGQKAPVDQGNLRPWGSYPGENILDSVDEDYMIKE
jgi:hypothetical protein